MGKPIKNHKHFLGQKNFLYNYLFYVREILIFFLIITYLAIKRRKKLFIWWGIIHIIFIGFFFRNPKINIIQNKNLIFSPSSGKVKSIEKIKINNQNYNKLYIYLSPANEHILISPISGYVENIKNIPNEMDQERKLVVLKNFDDKKIYIEQAVTKMGSTGWMSKFLVNERVVINLEKNDFVNQGNRYGFIRFGSEVQIYLPEDYKIIVNIGDKLKIGKSILAKLN